MLHCNYRYALMILTTATACSAAIHVSPGGDDANPGTSERPLATIQRAVALSRGTGDRNIVLRGGWYLDVAVTLTAEDSGLTIESAPGEKAHLFGGIPISDWRKDGEKFYAARLPADRDGEIRMLLIDGRLCPRARFPEEGELTHETTFNVRWMSTTGGGWQRKPTTQELSTLVYKPGDIPADLDVRSAEITVYHMWDESCVGIASNNPESRTLTLFPATGHPPGAFGVRKYVLWNIPQGMTRPGQWYHDRAAGRIVYWPLPGQDMAAARAVVPTQNTILRLRGAPGNPIRNVTIRDLALSATNVPLIAAGFAAARFDGAISLSGAANCTFKNLAISHVAGHGIDGRRDCSGIRVENCEVLECGAGGIYVGGTGAVITNNHVAGVGRSYPSAVGIFRGGRDCVVSHNEVHDTTYSAINYGGENNVIEYNLIYDCMKVLHDGAAIYVFGGKNTVLRRNFARDIIDTGGYGASAYYLDEQSENCVVEENFSINVAWPSHNHMARKNTIRNNVFIVPGDAKITFPRCADYTMEGNVLYAAGRIRIEGINAVTRWSRNILHSEAGKIEGVELKDYSPAATGQGLRGDTITDDPLFVDWKNGDYRYKAGSPAEKLGLKPANPSEAGRRK